MRQINICLHNIYLQTTIQSCQYFCTWNLNSRPSLLILIRISRMQSTEKDIKVRKALAWKALQAWYFTEATEAIASVCPWSLPWCPWNAPVQICNFLIGCPLPRRKCLGALALSKTKHTALALHDMKKIWTSQLPKGLKLRFFHAAIETILLYGCESWTLTKALTKSINGCYTRMLRMAQNVSWRDHITNLELYGNIPPLSEKIKERWLRLAGHCLRHPAK